ncbi:hypothetical protein [Mesorhizobium sp. M7A.F.Ca.US.014.04.1.1]|uniref:hypothetical protein n=1 Tax=Mesorhizobium sp. M7A.F.Ca.US.014.04.1.1 TaxID=2496744 RepID=UPI0007A942BA|nr:hypothetical protein [Mesorhizobium sp. M7A.F.Ca.US.014.04.1.1]AMX97878.1 hypothetical protein A4R28_32325 [Mesorhizobium ciceri]
MKLFATCVWGFGFSRAPLATMKGHVDRLHGLAYRGDCVALVGTQTDSNVMERRPALRMTMLTLGTPHFQDPRLASTAEGPL